MFPSASGFMINGGTFITTTSTNQSKRGFDLLMEYIATDAFHNSDELYDAPKCHPHTRVAVLDDIMRWVMESDSEVQDDFMMWLFGPAGAGKSAIARKIAELAAKKDVLIGSFFFSRTSSTRNSKGRLIPTLAYQMTVSIPGTRNYIEDAIERDPAIFKKDIQTQIDVLLLKPFQSVLTHTIPCPKLIIIDGLDECSNSQAQIAVLDAISRSFATHKLPIRCLVASRPETDLVSSFNSNEPLKSIHRRLALDDTYRPDDDIRLFFSDKFNQIRCTHRLRSTIPALPWPTKESLDALVKKSSGQFIFAATVVRFVESNRHQPSARLDVILQISPAGTINPFTELDALYKQILSSVDDIQPTLRVLSFYTSTPDLAYWLDKIPTSEHFLSLESGDIDRALIDLSSIVSYDELSGKVKILHASLVDFLSDKRRSGEFHIDMAGARADFACRTLQYVKGPDGIRAGDLNVFAAGIVNNQGCRFTDRLRKDILDFELDAFITATIESSYSPRMDAISKIFSYWMYIISEMGLGNEDTQILIHRYRSCFESRIQKYQSDWRLQLLLTLKLAVVIDYSPSRNRGVPLARRLDILLEMDDRALHPSLVDRDALDLCYSSAFFAAFNVELRDITLRYVDGDRYASAALHCMRFLSDPPKYCEIESNVSPETGVTYAEWMETCHMALLLLCVLLERANTSLEVIQFMSDHDIDTRVQKNLPVIDIWRVDRHILAFLGRGGVCVNWRIVSAIRRALKPASGK